MANRLFGILLHPYSDVVVYSGMGFTIADTERVRETAAVA